MRLIHHSGLTGSNNFPFDEGLTFLKPLRAKLPTFAKWGREITGTEWRLVHRHADPLVNGISLKQAAALARGERC